MKLRAPKDRCDGPACVLRSNIHVGGCLVAAVPFYGCAAQVLLDRLQMQAGGLVRAMAIHVCAAAIAT